MRVQIERCIWLVFAAGVTKLYTRGTDLMILAIVALRHFPIYQSCDEPQVQTQLYILCSLQMLQLQFRLVASLGDVVWFLYASCLIIMYLAQKFSLQCSSECYSACAVFP